MFGPSQPDPDGPSPRRAAPQAEFTAALLFVHLGAWAVLRAAIVVAGLHLHGSEFLVALGAAVGVVSLPGLRGDEPRPSIGKALAVFAGTWAASVALSALVSDLSWDGQTYHAIGIEALAGRPSAPFPWLALPDDGIRLWVNHYPRAPWLWASSLHELTGNYQAAKATNAVLLVTLFSWVHATARRVWPRGPEPKALLLALLASANPVALAQVGTFYVDGQLASLVSAYLAGLLLWTTSSSGYALLGLSAVAFLLANIKVTGIVYGGILVGATAVLAWRQFGPRALGPALALAAACLVPFVGTPIDNVLMGKHAFYPFVGPGSTDVLRQNRPRSIADEDPAARLVFSLFSETANGCRDCPVPVLKVPLTVSKQEVIAAGFPDPRTGGFGPLFSACLLAAAALVLLERRRLPRWMLVGAGLALVTACIDPEAWWARFVPQLWVLAVLPLGLWGESGTIAARSLLGVLLALVLADVGIVGGSALFRSASETVAAREELRALVGRKVAVDLGDWQGVRQRIEDAGLEVEEVAGGQLPCGEPQFFRDTAARYCVVGGLSP